MARTKAEIRKFLDSQVGQSVNAKSRPYQGQCVSLIKALLEFLGAPNPYAARGNAKDVGDTLLRQGIAKNGNGWLRVVVNRNMGNIGGVTYGHIWIDLAGETNYEQNGSRALHTTKGTRPYSQRQQVVNLDKYIKADPKPATSSSSTYTVKKGDTMSGIAAKYKMTLAALAKLNPQVKNLNQIDVGDKIKVKGSAPAAKKYVTVKAGWGLSNVAQAAGFGDAWSENRWAAIARLNGSTNWRTFNNRLVPGQKVRVK